MASYVAHHTKKLEMLEQKELKLKRLLKRGTSEEKLLEAALLVRDARVRVFKAKLATIPPKDDPQTARQLSSLRDKISRSSAISPDAVLAEFRRESGP